METQRLFPVSPADVWDSAAAPVSGKQRISGQRSCKWTKNVPFCLLQPSSSLPLPGWPGVTHSCSVLAIPWECSVELNVSRLHACFVPKDSFGEVSSEFHVTGERKRGSGKGPGRRLGGAVPGARGPTAELGCAACSLLLAPAPAAGSCGEAGDVPGGSRLCWPPAPARDETEDGREREEDYCSRFVGGMQGVGYRASGPVKCSTYASA